jgi:hypothetical protein
MSECRVNPDGSQQWIDENRWLHRLDGPAVIWPNGDQEWYVGGFCHRIDGPAVERISDQRWEWCFEGKWHRLDGPASISRHAQIWYLHGLRHRLDGPAFIHADGGEEWWVFGNDISADVLDWIDRLGLGPWQQWGDRERTLFRVSF